MPVGLLGNQNLASALIAICFPAFLRPKWIYLIPIPIIGLILAKTSGGALAVAVGMLVYAKIKGLNWYYFFGILACGVAYAMWELTASSESSRIEAWKSGFLMWQKNWLAGWGIGHWKVLFKELKIGGIWWTTAHNEPLQMTVETGILFPVILVGYAYGFINKIRHNKELVLPFTAIVITFFNSLVNFPFHIATTAIAAITWMAIYDTAILPRHAD